MRNFLRLAQNEPVSNLAQELARKPHLWDANPYRRSFPGSALTEVRDILIRYPDTEDGPDYFEAGHIQRPLIWHPAAAELPSVRPLVARLMVNTGAHTLGRVFISRLAPGDKIAPHRDVGTDYTSQENIARYHVAIEGHPGSLFQCGEEVVCMVTGDVWWFAADVEHSLVNNSAHDRISLCVDLILWS